MTAEAPTPRTDAVVVTGNGVYHGFDNSIKRKEVTEWVPAEHARTLERESAALRAELEAVKHRNGELEAERYNVSQATSEALQIAHARAAALEAERNSLDMNLTLANELLADRMIDNRQELAEALFASRNETIVTRAERDRAHAALRDVNDGWGYDEDWLAKHKQAVTEAHESSAPRAQAEGKVTPQ